MRIDDIAKLYTGKRSSSYGRSSFRELADFIAHPDLRVRGPVTDRIRDMRTTFRPLLDRALKGNGARLDDVIVRCESNFRMADEEQISRLSGGRKRQQAQRILSSAVRKMKNGDLGKLSNDEQELAIAFGDRVIWNPALRAQQVFDDFKDVLLKNQLLNREDIPRLNQARSMVVLHAITVMHGVAFDLGDGLSGELQAGFQNPDGCLEVTALLTLKGYSKNVSMKVGLLWTDLQGIDYVDSELVAHPGPWRFGIELKDAVVVPIGEVVANQKTSDGTAVIRVK
ncbi:hypothetical protein [uncultured Roseobacter sp.]|uniref:hypothetical protein n=1 Tax=uncultured Roseobacter sp. TaxID=114847 RepID=UPI0026367D64|nr:hypothetical protein [uncultured Roseobacter sp.]